MSCDQKAWLLTLLVPALRTASNEAFCMLAGQNYESGIVDSDRRSAQTYHKNPVARLGDRNGFLPPNLRGHLMCCFHLRATYQKS